MNAPVPPPGFFDIRTRGFRARTEVTEVIRLIDARVGLLGNEAVALAQTSGRILSEDVRSEVAVPGFDRAAMDGYAVRAEETFGAGAYNPLELRIIGTALPGKPFAGQVDAGQAVRIMTGAPVPVGVDAVLPFELAQEEAGLLRVSEPIAPGRHLGRRSEDVEPGTLVLTAGRRLRPQDLGLLASLGIASVPVVRRPRVDILVTGDELLPVGMKPEGCTIVDSNSVMLSALVRRDGGEPGIGAILPDRRDALANAVSGSDAAKFAVVAKSPHTFRLNDALSSSHFALAGKRTGADVLVIIGACSAPSVLVIDDGAVRVEAAGDLWGQTTAAATRQLGERFGRDYHSAVIGPAGEHCVRDATISHANRHAGRGGLGAVMGAKNLKAVLVAGSRRVEVADPERVVAAARDLSQRSFGPATAKYRELGTVANLLTFNRPHALPKWCGASTGGSARATRPV